MSAFEIARAIANLETSADLLEQAAEALTNWDGNYNPECELETARKLHFKALSLRVLLETEKREKVLH
jgi:hypothetical protein